MNCYAPASASQIIILWIHTLKLYILSTYETKTRVRKKLKNWDKSENFLY
jgi:hypothetical protein